MMSFSELEKEKLLVLLVPNDQPYFLIHSAFSLFSPSLDLPFPHSLLSCRLWLTSPPIAPGSGPLQRCFVSSYGKPGLIKFMHLYPLFFFCQKCVTCPFFSGKLCQSTEALFSYDFLSEVIPSSKCGLCGPPVLLHPLVHISIAGHSTYCIVCLFCLHLLTIPSLTQDYH